MNRSRKAAKLHSVISHDNNGNVSLPADLTLSAAPHSGDNSSRVTTTAWIRTYVGAEFASMVASAPATLDTLAELAAALGNDPNFATTVATSIGTRVPQTRTITINGVSFDLSADRSWTIAGGVTSFNTRTGAITLISADVTGALGFTPYNATNPSGYITGITSGMVTTALGYTPYNSSNPSGYITGYTETDTLASVTGRGATTSSIVTFTSTSSAASVIVRNDGSGEVWRGRVGHFNATADKSVWLASYNGFAVVGAHNNALTAWADLLVNCVDNSGSGGTVRLAASAFVGSNAIIHAGNIGSQSVSYALNSTRLYASNAPYTFGGGSPYYMTMNYDGTRWLLEVTPGTPAAVRVAYADTAGSVNSVAWGNISSKPSYLMYYQGFTLDANTMDTNSTGFTYGVNAPFVGPIARFSAAGSYDLWINSPYSGGGTGFAFRTRNGDTGSINPWRYPAVYGVNANGGGDLYATIYYDQSNTGYYVDPASTSNLYYIQMPHLGNGSANIRVNQGASENWRAIWLDGGTGNMGIGVSSAGRSVFGRASMSMHIGSSEGFRVHSDGWDTVFEVTGAAGNGWFKGDVRSPIYYDSNDTGYYLDPASTLSGVLRGNLRFNDYGAGVIGFYDSARYQGVFSMGPAYVLPINGTGPGNLYGIAWSHPNAGGVAANLNTHGALFLENGGFLAAISGSIRARDDMRAPIFYDSNDTTYYLNPASTSQLNTINQWGWTYQYSNNGIYWANYSRGFASPEYEGNPYGTITTVGSGRNGWSGYGIGAGWTLMGRDGVDLGLHSTAYGWVWYTPFSGGRISFGGSGGDGFSRIYVDGIGSATSSFRSPIFYDSDNTAFFCDPNSQSELRTLRLSGGATGSVFSELLIQRTQSGAATTIQSGANIEFFNTGSGRAWTLQTSNTVFKFFHYDGSAWQDRFRVLDSGGLANVQANNTNISDLRLKKDIVQAPSYWNVFKNINIVKFRYNDQTDLKHHVGVIAQELEAIAPEFVSSSQWDEEQGIKTVYTSDLHHATISVLREALIRIEQLESQLNEKLS